MSRRDPLSWVLGIMAVGFGGLYLAESATHSELQRAEAQVPSVDECAAHAAGIHNEILMLSCVRDPKDFSVPNEFSKVVVRVGKIERRCEVVSAHIANCKVASVPIRADAQAHRP